jgi:hypothetical protein
MGLDIYHLRANAAGKGSPFVLDDAYGKERLREKFDWCLREVDFPIIDWSKTLAALGFDKSQYDLRIAMPADGQTRTGQRATTAGFRRRPRANIELPELLFVTNSDAPAAVKKRIHRGWGDNAVVLTAEYVRGIMRATSVYAEEIGYQRKAVAAAFYDEFRPSEWILDIARVRRIHELTDEDSRDEFESGFLDTWDERTSFVLVSW